MPYGDIRQLDAEQQRIIRKLIRGGRKHLADLPPRERRKAINTAIAVGYTESRYRNLPGGDRDSQGWRQERAMYYPNPRNLDASIKRFYAEYRGDANKKAPLGVRAQQVQQSGTPHVWDGIAPMANDLRKRFSGKAGGSKYAPKRRGSTTTTKFIPGVDNSGMRRDLKLDYLREGRHKPGGLLALASSLEDAKDIAAKTIVQKARPITGSPLGGRGAARAARVERRADRMDRMRRPYVWGGGHGPKPDMNGPWDCSGAVSALFGISPRVSGQFESWGKPGRGKFITVYANSKHVLMEVNGRFWGTSRSNPGGGAGWIPRSQVSKSYLAQFTARHPG